MFLLIDKPTGFTSFDMIRKLQKLYPDTKIGHSGTLDPMATGLLVIGMGKDTKNLQNILLMDKDYITEVDFSKMSDTWDLDYWDSLTTYDIEKIGYDIGISKDGKFVKAPQIEDIRKILDSIVPQADLPLPNFSAKKVGGKKLYDLARDGEQLNLTRTMKIYSYEIVSYEFPIVKIKLTVGSGCYIRSIGYYLGQQLGLGGILVSLRRSRIGNYILPEK